jgi:hypothetical protein
MEYLDVIHKVLHFNHHNKDVAKEGLTLLRVLAAADANKVGSSADTTSSCCCRDQDSVGAMRNCQLVHMGACLCENATL